MAKEIIIRNLGIRAAAIPQVMKAHILRVRAICPRVTTIPQRVLQYACSFISGIAFAVVTVMSKRKRK